MSRFIIRKVAVLGAGVMGAQIAAHLANLNVPVLLYDLPGPDAHDAITRRALEHLAKIKPAPLALASRVEAIQAKNYEDHLPQLAQCDLIIEAIAERMDWKTALYQRIAPFIAEHTLLASNTSGLSLTTLSAALPAALRPRFCGVHFFNPPRYMSLMELIPTPHTNLEVVDQLETFATSTLGKQVVRALDTPNFVANRVGVASLLFALIEARKQQLTLDVVDDLTGRKLGRASSGTYRTADVVGLDTLMHVVGTLQEQLPRDPFHPCYATPEVVERLIAAGALGAKSGVGFYKKVGRDILRLEESTGEYVPAVGKADPAVTALLKLKPAERLAALRASDHPQARFVWALYRDIFHYCAVHLGTIAHSARDIDMAMRWGFGWKEGPFETWQQAGWRTVAQWIQEDIDAGLALVMTPLPAWVFDGREGVHQPQGSWDAGSGQWVARHELPVHQRQLFPETVVGTPVANPQQAGTTVFEDDFLRAWTLDDTFLIATLKTKMRTFNAGALLALDRALSAAESDFQGLVLWGPGEPFSAGGDLSGFLVTYAQHGLDGFVAEEKFFQDVMRRLRYSSIPTVAAARGYALGGGCEAFIHCDRRVAHLETYVGLVEVNVGLLPGAGGLTTLARQAGEMALFMQTPQEVIRYLKESFARVMRSDITTSALEARQAGWMQPGDLIVAHPDELLHVALAQVRALAESGYRPPLQLPFPVAGREGKAVLQGALVQFNATGLLTDHDVVIGTAIADVLCGGDVDAGTTLTEESLLALERKNFGALMSLAKSRERIQILLETGKPRRN